MTAAAARRPAVHFTPRSGWMNDPHGIVFHEGHYHLFFQHVPDSLVWRTDIQWGHAVSTDLVHWEQLQDALSPAEDEAGCWSGGLAVDAGGRAVIAYTSAGGHDHQLGRIRLAHPVDDDWLSWEPGEIVATAPRAETVVFRDPVVFRDGHRWRMVVGFGDADGTAGAEVFVSDDLSTWAYDGTLATRHGSEQDPWTGVAWECPQLLHVDDRTILVESSWENHRPNEVVAAVGTYADGRFDAQTWQQLTAAGGHYAATRFVDEEGRECLLFWIRGIAEHGAWTGAMSVPYVVTLDGDRIRLVPHPNLESARGDVGDDWPGWAIDLEWKPSSQGTLRFRSAGGDEVASIAADGRLLTITTGTAAPVVVAHESDVLRVLLDGPMLEVVADGGIVGLPLPAVADGVHPSTDPESHLTWWHLS